jgi:hypothetical protein
MANNPYFESALTLGVYFSSSFLLGLYIGAIQGCSITLILGMP